jgi:hypothetical protein
MKITSIGYAAISIVSICFLMLVPYGNPGIQIYGFWPVTTLLVVVIMYWARRNLEQRTVILTVCVIGWGVMCFLSSRVAHRDKRFNMELEGIVSTKYRGGHNLPSIYVTTNSAGEFPVEGLIETQWNEIHIGDDFTKHGRTFQAHCGNLSISLVTQSVIDNYRLK